MEDKVSLTMLRYILYFYGFQEKEMYLFVNSLDY